MEFGANDGYERFNKEAKAWGSQLARTVRQVVPVASGELQGSIKPKSYINKTSLALEAIRLSFARQGIFVDLGVGLGRPVGSAAAAAKKTNILGRTIDNRFPQLERIIDQYYGEGAANAISANIPEHITFKSA